MVQVWSGGRLHQVRPCEERLGGKKTSWLCFRRDGGPEGRGGRCARSGRDEDLWEQVTLFLLDSPNQTVSNVNLVQSCIFSGIFSCSILLLIIFYYFAALCINAELYNINHTALDEETLLSLLDWRQYFFNAGVIALSSLAFVAAIPGRVTAVEKLLSLTFFASITMSALKYDMHGNGTSMVDKLDIIAQEGITAILSVLGAFLICRLLRLIQ